MRFPAPVPGLVIRYSYLWLQEHLKGLDEGVKDRPCAVILVTTDQDGDQVVTVLPITHVPPSTNMPTLEIPRQIKVRLGLDDERSWIVLAEVNRFIWPGPDVRPAVRGTTSSIACGQLPVGFFAEVLARFLEVYDSGHSSIIPRTE